LPILTTRIFGFLLGSTVAGAGLYYYVVDEYRVSNELLTEDVYVSSVQSNAACYVGAARPLAYIYIYPSRRFNPLSRGLRAMSRVWNRMSSRGNRRTGQQQ